MALQRGLNKGRPEIHHSDQGVQYASQEYVSLLEPIGVLISMAAVGQLTENPHAERVMRTIKEEEVYLADYENFADTYHRIGHFIEDVYQTKRAHSALGYLTPAEFESAYRDRMWRSPNGAPRGVQTMGGTSYSPIMYCLLYMIFCILSRLDVTVQDLGEVW